MVFEEVETELPEMWSPKEVDDCIEGTYIKKKHDVGKNKSNVYILECNGKAKSLWGSTVLDDKMTYCSILDKVRITYLGEDEEKKYKKFKVEVDRDAKKSKD